MLLAANGRWDDALTLAQPLQPSAQGAVAEIILSFGLLYAETAFDARFAALLPGLSGVENIDKQFPKATQQLEASGWKRTGTLAPDSALSLLPGDQASDPSQNLGQMLQSGNVAKIQVAVTDAFLRDRQVEQAGDVDAGYLAFGDMLDNNLPAFLATIR